MGFSFKTIIQKAVEVKDKVEDVANNVKSSVSGFIEDAADAMHIVPKDKNEVLTMPTEETIGGTTYSYSMNDVSATSSRAAHYNPATGKQDRLSDIDRAETEAGSLYKDKKYVAVVGPEGLEKGPKERPTFSELVKEDAAGSEIHTFRGTLYSPNLQNKLVPENLFIDGTPSVDDVRQCNIGDCYFLAALLHIIQNDPEKITSMISIAGNEVTTRFYYRPTAIATRWYQTTIKTQLGELVKTTKNGDDENSTTYGGYYRISYDPQSSRWFANFDDTQLKITRQDYYQAALWVTSMEHAFEVFAKTHGKFGLGKILPNDLVSGTESGFTPLVMNIFYGADSSPKVPRNTHLAGEDGDVLTANRHIIKELLNFANSKNGSYDKDVCLTASINEPVALHRMLVYANRVRKELSAIDSEELNDAKTDAIDCIDKLISSEARLTDLTIKSKLPWGDKDAINDQIKTEKNTMDELAVKLNDNEAVKSLTSDNAMALQRAIGCVVEYKDRNIYIYSAHAYNVSDVSLVDAEGNSLAGKSLNEVMASIDIQQSTVTMQNPHAQTKPQFHPDKVERPNEGTFDTPLQAFLENVGTLEIAEITRKK